MIDVLKRFEGIRSKLLFAVVSGHSFIPVSRVMGIVNRITRLLGHSMPMDYDNPDVYDSPQRKVYDALDSANQDLKDLLVTRKREVVEKIGESRWEDFYSLLSEIVAARDKALDKEHGPGASLLKRGRKFHVSSTR